MGLFGTDSKGKKVNVAFGSGGGAVQAHKAAVARREAAAARRAKAAQASRKRGK